MSGPKIRAAMWVAACALYMVCGEVLRQQEITLGAIFSLVLGMICAAECFQCGQEHERERQRQIEEACDAWIEAGNRLSPARCRSCGCPEFSRVAGRMVCICCGSVLEDCTDGKKQV